MKLFLRRNAPLFYAIAAMLALYVPWLNRRFNNYEYPYWLAARSFAFEQDVRLIDSYIGVVGNPMGTSFTLSLLYRILPLVDEVWFPRILGVLGMSMVLLACWIMAKETFSKSQWISFSSLLILHPMYFVYSTSITADVLPVGLSLLSLVIAYKLSNSPLTYMFAFLIFGISIIFKYNGIYLWIGLVIATTFSKNFVEMEKYKKRWVAFFSFATPALVASLYMIWSKSEYGFFVSSQLENSKPNFTDAEQYLFFLFKYLSFFGIFLSPSIFFVFKDMRKAGCSRLVWLAFFLLVGSITFFWSSLRDAGELDFGLYIEQAGLASRALETFGSVSASAFAVYSIKLLRRRSKLNSVIVFTILPYILAISTSYPSQRYLLYVVPFGFLSFFVGNNRESFISRLVLLSILLIFSFTSFLGMSYLTSQGNASEEMAVWVEDNNLISQTSAGAIRPHAGQHWWGVAPDETRYEIIAVTPSAEAQVKERILHREPMKVLGKVTRVYLLREIPAAP